MLFLHAGLLGRALDTLQLLPDADFRRRPRDQLEGGQRRDGLYSRVRSQARDRLWGNKAELLFGPGKNARQDRVEAGACRADHQVRVGLAASLRAAKAVLDQAHRLRGGEGQREERENT
jgi:hypothetical protein